MPNIKKSITDLMITECKKRGHVCQHWPEQDTVELLVQKDLEDGTNHAHRYIQTRHQPFLAILPMSGKAEIRCATVAKNRGSGEVMPCAFCDVCVGEVVWTKIINEFENYLGYFKSNLRKNEKKPWQPIPQHGDWVIPIDTGIEVKEKEELHEHKIERNCTQDTISSGVGN